jgi:hypothetical protein
VNPQKVEFLLAAVRISSQIDERVADCDFGLGTFLLSGHPEAIVCMAARDIPIRVSNSLSGKKEPDAAA